MNALFKSNADLMLQGSAYLERPRLEKLLAKAMDFPLVAVYAGAGYGKTRAVYSFMQNYGAHTIWMQLSERDNVGTRFWESYTHLVAQSMPEAGLRLLEIGFPDSDEAFRKFEAMMREIETMPGKYVLVFDDFHLLNNLAVLRFLEKTFDTLPPGATVILISRTMPEVNIVGMMMRERVFTIREDALCFTEDEIAEYFQQLALPVSRQGVRDIRDDTQGWAFAINLIGRSLRAGTKYERYALDAVKSNIFKLMEAEVIRSIPDALWRFLLRISLIDHLAADLIRTLAGDDALIEEMELLNAYIRYDSFLNAYVIHHLLLDYLRQNQGVLTDGERQETCRKAAAWCEDNNYQTDALSYYEKAEDFDSILRIVYTFDGQAPQDIARYSMEIFERIPEEAASRQPLFPAMHLKLKINLGMLEEASVLAERYVNEYEKRPESAEKNRTLMGIYHVWALARLLMSPYTGIYDFDNYFRKMKEYRDKSPFMESGPSTRQSVGAWAIIAGESRPGALEEYIEAASRVIPYTASALDGNMYGFDDLARGEYFFYRRDLSDAEKFLNKALDKARSRKQYDIQNRALFYLMHLAFIRGNYPAAETKLKAMEEMLGEKEYAIRYTTYDVARGFFYLRLNMPEEVPDWLKGEFAGYAHPALLENYTNRVRVLYHYQTRQIGSLLAFLEGEAHRQPILLGKIEAKVMTALSYYQLKRRGEAIRALAEAYSLAEPNGISIPFIVNGKDMRTLSAAAMADAKGPIPLGWLEDINRKASTFAKRQSHMIAEYKAVNQLGEGISLTKRETEILRDMSQGLSRSEIAANYKISINTVKMVINNIYDKLYVNSLADAIRVAVKKKIV